MDELGEKSQTRIILDNFVNKALSYFNWLQSFRKMSFIGLWLIPVDICFIKNCTQILTLKEGNDEIKTKGYTFSLVLDIDVGENCSHFNPELKTPC